MSGCRLCGYPEADHVGDGEMIHDFRPESGGQQQAAAEVERIGQSLATHVREVGEALNGLESLLAEAARPGQELRERVRATCEALDWEAELIYDGPRLRGEITRDDDEIRADTLHTAAARLRAALGDPR